MTSTPTHDADELREILVDLLQAHTDVIRPGRYELSPSYKSDYLEEALQRLVYRDKEKDEEFASLVEAVHLSDVAVYEKMVSYKGDSLTEFMKSCVPDTYYEKRIHSNNNQESEVR